MKKIVQFQIDETTTIAAELDEPAGAGAGVRPAGRGEVVIDMAKVSFQEAMEGLKPVANTVMRVLGDINNPSEIGVEFGVKLSAAAGVVVASAASEANFVVKLTWKKEST